MVRDRLEDAQWRETAELFATCLYDLGHPDRVDRLLGKVLALGGGDDLENEARVAAVVGRLLPAVEVCGYKLGPELRQVYEEARRRVMAIFEEEGAKRVPVKLRIAASEVLGRGGDPRLLPEVDNFLPVPGLEVRLIDLVAYERRLLGHPAVFATARRPFGDRTPEIGGNPGAAHALLKRRGSTGLGPWPWRFAPGARGTGSSPIPAPRRR